jgi:uncharacterized membrane protein YjjP (DUF1212 family)
LATSLICLSHLSRDPSRANYAICFDLSACYMPLLGRTLFFGMEANMNAAFSFLISIGIIAFGIWIAAAGTIGGSSPLSWSLMGLLTVIVGSMSLYQAIRDLKTA